MQFSEFGLSSALLRAVETSGYTIPTPIQSLTIPHLLQGRDVLGCAQTGTGKTAAFALPILERLGQGAPARTSAIRVLVLAPTRELASQIGQSFQVYGRHTGLRVTEIFGGVSQVPQVRALQQGTDILVATPGRLVDLMGQGYVRLDRVEVFVLDEADRMLDMGFLPDLRKIVTALPVERQNVLFSATMPTAVESLARKILRRPVAIRIAATRSAEPRIHQSVCLVPKHDKTRLLAAWLQRDPASRSFVFTRTKHGADRVVKQLQRFGIDAEAIHGNKSQSARQNTLSRFKMNHTQVLVATDLAARGLDVDSVTHVFNYDVPVDAETYVHRIGRTGRAGAEGRAISFCDPEEQKYLRAIERLVGKTLPTDSTCSPEDATEMDRPARSPRATTPPANQSHRQPAGVGTGRRRRPNYSRSGR